MDWWSTLAWIVAVLVLTVTYWYFTVPKNLPPGSSGLPILGYLPFIDPKAYLTLTALKKKYGDVFYLYMGSQLVVVLNDFKSIKDALSKQGEAFSGRITTSETSEHEGESKGVLFTDGDHWRHHRKFTMRNLRDPGQGKQSLEPQLHEEILFFLREVKKHDGKGPFDIKDYLFTSMTNNINILVTGSRYDYDSPAVKIMMQMQKDFDKLSQGLPPESFFPWLKPIFTRIGNRYVKMNELKEKYINLVQDVIDETKADANRNENFVEAYTNEMSNNKNIFTDTAMLQTIRDLISAGTDTTATTLTWAALYMAKYPQIQKKAQEEIGRVIGDREPSYNDRNNTPYTEATIWEVHRNVSLVPLSLPHRVIQNTSFNGYNIPKDTMVLPNIWAVHNDANLWGDPQNFRPERFINQNEECVKPEYLIPFSFGKRSCAGEPLARIEIYLYFVTLLQNFTFLPPEGEELSVDAPPGITRNPQSKFIRVKSRQ